MIKLHGKESFCSWPVGERWMQGVGRDAGPERKPCHTGGQARNTIITIIYGLTHTWKNKVLLLESRLFETLRQY